MELAKIKGPSGTTFTINTVPDYGYVEINISTTIEKKPVWVGTIMSEFQTEQIDDLITALQYARKVVKDNETEQESTR